VPIYCPAMHAVIAVHCRSVEPAIGGVDSHSSVVHAVCRLQTKLVVLSPSFTTYSLELHGVCGTHAESVCKASLLNVSAGQGVQMLVGSRRNSPAVHSRCVVVVAVVVVAVVVVVVVSVALVVVLVIVVDVNVVDESVVVVVVPEVEVNVVVVVVSWHCRSETDVHGAASNSCLALHWLHV
jgi:hypothetical protein